MNLKKSQKFDLEANGNAGTRATIIQGKVYNNIQLKKIIEYEARKLLESVNLSRLNLFIYLQSI